MRSRDSHLSSKKNRKGVVPSIHTASDKLFEVNNKNCHCETHVVEVVVLKKAKYTYFLIYNTGIFLIGLNTQLYNLYIRLVPLIPEDLSV